MVSGRAAAQGGGDERSRYQWDRDVDAQAYALRALSELETTSGETAISNFEGEHLAVDEDGQLHAQSAVTYHDIDEYGADPTGAKPSDEAFDAAVDAAVSHDIIAMTNGTYYFADQHNIDTPVTLLGSGSRIESDVNQEAHRSNQRPGHHLFRFSGAGAIEETSLTSSAATGADQIEVDDASIFDVGDFVRITNHESRSSRAYEPTFAKVRGKDGDTLVLAGNLRYDYYSGQSVEMMSMLERPAVYDVHVRPREEPYFDEDLERILGGPERPIVTNHCYGFVMKNCSFEHYDQHAWIPIDDFRSTAINCRASYPMNKHGSHGEAFIISGSNDITFINPTIEECRRGIDIRSGCKDVVVINPHITSAMLAGLSYHGNVKGNMIVIGGYVAGYTESDPTLHPSESTARAGIAVIGTRYDNSRTELYGVELRGTARVASLGGVKNFKAVGCTIGAISNALRYPIVTVGEEGGTSSENVSLVDCTIEVPDSGTSLTNAISVTAGRNITLDVELRGPHTAGVELANASWLDVDVTANAPDGECTITVGEGVENARITGHLRQNAAGLRVTGGCSDIHVREFITAGGPAVEVDTEDGTVENLRLHGVVSADGGGMDFGESLIDGLWIRDCHVDRISNLHPAQDGEFTVIDGNRERGTNRRRLV